MSEERAITKPVKTLREMLNSEEFKAALHDSLPAILPPERFVRIANTALTKTPDLLKCDRNSFFKCLLDLSQLGLEPDGRRAHLIPFKNNKQGTVDCQLLIDYKGLVELARRSGTISTIHADVVCENDEFTYDCGQITKHIIDFRKPRGAVYAVYALCTMRDGTTQSVVLGRDEIESIRKRSRAGNSGPWVTDWNEMAKKTAFRRLSKWLTLSPELHKAIQLEDDEYTKPKPRVINGLDDLISDSACDAELREQAEISQ